MRFVLESTTLVNETKEVRLVGTVPYKSKYINSNTTTSLLMLQVIPNLPHEVSSVGSQLDKASVDPFRLFFYERRALPCGLIAKATEGVKNRKKAYQASAVVDGCSHQAVGVYRCSDQAVIAKSSWTSKELMDLVKNIFYVIG